MIGAAARPALRVPRWDRHLVPLPSAHIAIVYGEPIMVERGAEIDEALRSRVTEALGTAEKRAWAILSSRFRPSDRRPERVNERTLPASTIHISLRGWADLP